MHSALDVAHYFLCKFGRDGDESVSNMKLQKLVYYAQAWCLALLDRKLFEEEIQAWQHGPVIPSVYYEYRIYGPGPIPLPDFCDIALSAFDPDETEVLNSVYRKYGSMPALTLRRLTHAEDPWFYARGGLPESAPSTTRIQEEDMRRFYKSLVS